MQTGYVACPDCLSTFGLLGAESSFSTIHFAAPVTVFVAVQPGGGAPVVRLSKLIVSARAGPASIVAVRIALICVFIWSLHCSFNFRVGDRAELEDEKPSPCQARFRRRSSPGVSQQSTSQSIILIPLHPVREIALYPLAKSDRRCARYRPFRSRFPYLSLKQQRKSLASQGRPLPSRPPRCTSPRCRSG